MIFGSFGGVKVNATSIDIVFPEACPNWLKSFFSKILCFSPSKRPSPKEILELIKPALFCADTAGKFLQFSEVEPKKWPWLVFGTIKVAQFDLLFLIINSFINLNQGSAEFGQKISNQKFQDTKYWKWSNFPLSDQKIDFPYNSHKLVQSKGAWKTHLYSPSLQRMPVIRNCVVLKKQWKHRGTMPPQSKHLWGT